MNDPKRCLYLVCYDVADPRRWRQVYRLLLGYRVGGQKSFFECWLTPAELQHLRAELARLLEPAEDRAHIFQLDPRQQVIGMGQATQARPKVFMIV